MKTLKQICLAIGLATLLSGAAHADHYRHRQHGHHSHYSHHNGANVALLTIAGVAIGATTYRYYNPPAVYAPPPQVVYMPPYAPPAPASTLYFCRSSGQYYPYVGVCPEGWQILPAPPH
jgi:hypothetical protein